MSLLILLNKETLFVLRVRYKVTTPKGNEILLVMAEIYNIENGIIKNIRVYYDAEEFGKEFSS